MGYETDHPPIVYLERRIKYYKKQRGKFANMYKEEYYIRACGGPRKFKKLVAKRIKETNDRIAEYERAIEILKNNK